MAYPTATFPTNIDSPVDPTASDDTAIFDHAGLEKFQNDSVTAIETKVGINGSVDTTSFDYKLSGVTTGDKAVSKTGTETLTGKTLTSPIINTPTVNVGLDAIGDILVRKVDGTLGKVAAGASGATLTSNGVGTLPTYQTGTATSAAQVQNQTYSYAADTGSANAYAVTLALAPSAYATGQRFAFKATNANTTTSTLNVNSLGAVTIKKNVSLNLVANDILAGAIVEVEYDGTNFQMMSPVGNIQVVIGNKIATNTTGTTVTGTTTETSILTVSIPANTLGTSNAVRGKLFVTNYQQSTSTTCTFRLKYGATTIGSATIGTFATGLATVIDFVLVSGGSTSSQTGSLIVLGSPSSAQTAANAGRGTILSGTSTEDSTTALNVSVTVQFSSAAGDIVSTSGYIVEKIS